MLHALYTFLGALIGQLPTSQPAVQLNNIQDPPEGILLNAAWLVEVNDRKAGWKALRFARRGEWIGTQTESCLEFLRMGTPVLMHESGLWLETLAGQPIRFELTLESGPTRIKYRGEIDDGTLAVEIEQVGQKSVKSMPYPLGALMPWGRYREQRLHGFVSGTEYSLQEYDPSINLDTFIQRNYKVVGIETISLQNQERAATHVIQSTQTAIEHQWYDEQAVILRSDESLGGLGTLRTIRMDEQILATVFDPPELFESTFVPSNRALAPNRMVSGQYRLSLRDSLDVFNEIPQTVMQTSEPVTGNPVMIAVRRIDRLKLLDTVLDEPEDMAAYLSSNEAMNLDDPLLQTIASQVTSDVTDPWMQAHQLRQFVSAHLTGMSLEVMFATASETARTQRGDCTEYAVLLAALGRLAKIPSRVVVGLIYVPEFAGRKQFFASHMWTQFHIGGHWIDFDSALGESNCNPAHIALRTLSLESGSAHETGRSLLAYQGQIQLEVVEVETLDDEK